MHLKNVRRKIRVNQKTEPLFFLGLLKVYSAVSDVFKLIFPSTICSNFFPSMKIDFS